eukprot:m.23137 g.23137  ORF g.23137 m.23137 type:complete len:798 (-) comp14084_c0_seq1:81-2474(-)
MPLKFLLIALSFAGVSATSLRATTTCPTGFRDSPPGFWKNTLPNSNTGPVDHANGTIALCVQKCLTYKSCVAFEVYDDGKIPDRGCYIFLNQLQPPFTPLPTAISTTCVSDSMPPPPPPTPPPTRGKTTGHTFPRLGNCWGADPFIPSEMWNYLGYPNMTNATWGRYDTLYLNPFDSCCWKQQMNDWVPVIRAIKEVNPTAVVLATFHATEIWMADLSNESPWLPTNCLMRNVDGSVCSWWVNMVFTNNLFVPECFDAAVNNALTALPDLLAAGIDGVFLDGVVPYDLGCTSVDVNCTSPNCSHAPQPTPAALEAEWVTLYASWFAHLKAKFPSLLWVNNMVDSFESALKPVSNGRQYEGGAAGGANGPYAGSTPISQNIAKIRSWSTESLQPSYVHVSMNSDIYGPWRVGRWQNLVTQGEMEVLLTDFRRMRFGLGSVMMTDGYFANDLGGGFYGVPSFYTEYEQDLGQALNDPVCVFSAGVEEVWTREFEKGFVVVSGLGNSNFTINLTQPMHEVPLSQNPMMLTAQREAPAWQFVIDNANDNENIDTNIHTNSYTTTNNNIINNHNNIGKRTEHYVSIEDTTTPHHDACVCSPAAPACCPHAPGRPSDWWAGPGRRASFKTTAGNWTVVSDQGESHQVGNSFLVGFFTPGAQPQGDPPAYIASWTFVAPVSDLFHFSLSSVDAHYYPLTDGAIACVRLATSPPSPSPPPSACIANGLVDQRSGVRDGRWQSALKGVQLQGNVSYTFSLSMDPRRGGYVAADALLVESDTLYNGRTELQSEVVVGAMDARILLKP